MRKNKPELTVYRERGISLQSATQSQLKYYEPEEHANLMGNKSIQVPGIAIPYFDIEGKFTGFVRTKVLGSYIQAGSKKPAKYLSIQGSSPRIYFSMLLSWPKIAKDTSIPLVVTEGEFKAIKACQEGIHAIGLSGVWNWRKRDDDENSSPIACLNLIDWKGRTAYICYDSDAATNPQVLKAELALAKELFNRGAIPRIIRLPTLPGHAKTGLDDFIVTLKSKWKKAWEQLLKEASYPCTIRSVSSVEIVAAKYKAPKYIVDHLICAGMTTLNGAPKSGKSWAAIAIGHAVAVGNVLFGAYKVPNQGAVLYCAFEDTPRRIQSRLAIMKLKPSTNLSFAFAKDLKQGEDGCSMLERWCEENPKAKLIIIDTLQKFRAPSTGRQNAYEADYAAMGAIKNIADRYGLAILLIHHLRKAKSEDVFDQVSGSMAITGAADTNIVLIRERSKNEAFLHITGRDIEEQEIAMRFDSGIWTVLGDAQSYRLSAAQQVVIDAITMHGGPATPTQIAKLAGRKVTAMSRLLLRMVEKGLLKWSEGGLYSLNDVRPKQNPRY
jgi:predicted transcriptional regulator